MNENESKVLAYMIEEGCVGLAFPFEPIAVNTGLDRKVVRRACRSLARKGLAQFIRGLWDDEGNPAGSGYGPTELAFVGKD